MKYRANYGDQFALVLDDVSLRWTSDPPGHDLPASYTLRFWHEGDPSETPAKEFTVLPGGRVRLFRPPVDEGR